MTTLFQLNESTLPLQLKFGWDTCQLWALSFSKQRPFVNQPYTIQEHGCHAEKRGEDAIFLAMTRSWLFHLN